MARVDDDWVVGQLAHHRHGAQVKGVARSQKMI
jgi:hypothetical protein